MSASVEIVIYLDVLSSWCYVGDLALQRIEQKYGDQVRVDWRVALVTDSNGTIPYTRDQLAWFYERTKRISGVELTSAWVDSPQASSLHVNQAVEAVRLLGVNGAQVRRALAHVALIEGKPLARREPALEAAARASGLPVAQIDEAMRGEAVAQRIARGGKEFEARAFTQRPAFVMTDPIGDLAAVSGLYTFEALDAIVSEMLHASRVTEEFGPQS